MRDYQARVEASLDHWLPPATTAPTRLHEAMRYSTLGAGKRVRPFLAYATGVALNAPVKMLDGPACAVELVHVFSLVHDDLPAMDNDDLRRGKPTCHKAFDDATAVLVGDALQSLAFYILAHDKTMTPDTGKRLKMVEALTHGIGSRGMSGGQAMDLEAEGRDLNLTEMENIHIHKTGALIRASVNLGILSSPDNDKDTHQRLDHYAKCIGLAFQIKDDILDVEGDTATLGKTQGADQALKKSTYPEVMGMAAAKEKAEELHEQALASLEPVGSSADPLRWIASYIIKRTH